MKVKICYFNISIKFYLFEMCRMFDFRMQNLVLLQHSLRGYILYAHVTHGQRNDNRELYTNSSSCYSSSMTFHPVRFYRFAYEKKSYHLQSTDRLIFGENCSKKWDHLLGDDAM